MSMLKGKLFKITLFNLRKLPFLRELRSSHVSGNRKGTGKEQNWILSRFSCIGKLFFQQLLNFKIKFFSQKKLLTWENEISTLWLFGRNEKEQNFFISFLVTPVSLSKLCHCCVLCQFCTFLMCVLSHYLPAPIIIIIVMTVCVCGTNHLFSFKIKFPDINYTLLCNTTYSLWTKRKSPHSLPLPKNSYTCE